MRDAQVFLKILLFHHNFIIIFFWGGWGCIIVFIPASMIGFIFMLGKFPGSEFVRIEIAAPFSMC